MSTRLRPAIVIAAVTMLGWAGIIPAQAGDVITNPLTKAELQEQATPALEWFAELPESAGAYYDLDRPGTLVFQFATNTAARASDLRMRLPVNAKFEAKTAKYTTSELNAIKGRIRDSWEELKLRGVDLQSVGPDTRSNMVLVGVLSDPALATRVLADSFGDAVAVQLEPKLQADACTVSDCANPMKGGLAIDSEVPGYLCTTGWIMKQITLARLYILTAGHCLSKSGGVNPAEDWLHNGVSIGKEVDSTWANGADADAGRITVSIPSTQDKNWFYAGGATPLRHVTSTASTAIQVQFADVCRGARISGYKCGTIALTDRTKDVDGRLIDHQWVVNIADAKPGDSGAPYFWVNQAWGIHSSSTDVSPFQSWYSPVSWALLTLPPANDDVKICITPAC